MNPPADRKKTVPPAAGVSGGLDLDPAVLDGGNSAIVFVFFHLFVSTSCLRELGTNDGKPYIRLLSGCIIPDINFY
jgi:hypothetical protein